MKARSFFKNLSWLLVLNLLVKPVWIFAIDRQVQNVVGHEVYGIYFALFNLCYVLQFIADAGLSTMLSQKLATAENLNIRQLLRYKLALLLFYTMTCLLVAACTGVREWYIYYYLILIQSLTSFFLFLRSLLAAKQHFKADAFFSVLDKTLLLLLCVGPLYLFLRPMTIRLFLQLQTISISVATFSLLVFLLTKKEITTGSVVAWKTLVRWTVPFMLIILLMAAHNRLGVFLLERLHPEGALEAGLYAMAYRLLDAGNVAGYLTASFLLPFFSRHQQNKPLLQKVLLFSRHSLLFMAAGIIAFVLVFAPWLQQILYHINDPSNNTILRLCLFALPGYYLVHIYGTALTATAHFRLFIRVVLLALLTNSLLNVWLAPLYGALGCCIAAIVTQYGCGIALWITASRRLSVSYAAGTALLYPLTTLLAGSIFYIGQQLTENGWIILSSTGLTVTVILALQWNVIRKVFLSLYK